jgi:Cys-tRNA(Pro)/Cys-tRNA(Cys) deacylase
MAAPSHIATPAIAALTKLGVNFRVLNYDYDPDADAIGLAAAAALGVAPDIMLKTLVAELSDKRLVMAVIESDARLDTKALAKAAGAKTADLAPVPLAERTTGYVKGGISPLGTRKRLPVFISASAQTKTEVIVNGGKRGTQIALAPETLAQATGGVFAALVK